MSGMRLPCKFFLSARDTVLILYRKYGAVDNGKPGLREYRPGYYAAFVLDPVGNNVEVLHLG